MFKFYKAASNKFDNKYFIDTGKKYILVFSKTSYGTILRSGFKINYLENNNYTLKETLASILVNEIDKSMLRQYVMYIFQEYPKHISN